MSTSEPLIDVAGLSKAFAGRSVIGGVSLRLMPGGIIGLIGANGGGKTTTLRMLAGLLRPDCGTGTVLQADIRRLRPGRRRRIGYMGQRLALYPDISVRENLRFHATVHGLADSQRRIADVLARYGLDDVGQMPFGLLSGGWARRVQFAATVIHAPPLLLLDEPTAGLDTLSRRNIWAWLADLAAKGHGIVVSTHDLSEAERCSEILFYHQGRAHPPTSPATLIARTATASLDAAVAALAEAHPA